MGLEDLDQIIIVVIIFFIFKLDRSRDARIPRDQSLEGYVR